MYKNVFLTAASTVIAVSAMAQGTIIGKVEDGVNNETVIAADVQIFPKGDSAILQSTFTDENGKFEMELPEGTYDVHVVYDGFQTKMLTDVHVIKGQQTTFTVTLTDMVDPTELEDVVIRANYTKQSVVALYTQQKEANTMGDGISADVISKSPDRNTGDVLKRVSGTSIQDNKFVVVRGMNDRYNVAMVDGAILPSTEPNRKAFSFDIIPSAIIDNIVITKSGSPDLPGDFSGGVINILSKDMPNEAYTNFSLGTSFNTVSTFKDYYTGTTTPTDFFGFDDGTRQLPSSYPSYDYMARNYNSSNISESNKYLNSLNNDYKIHQRKAMPGINMQLAHGNSYALKNGNRFGINMGLTFSHDEVIKPNLIRQYDNYDYNDNIYGYRSNLGLLLNMGYLTAKSKVSFKTIYNKTFDNNHLQRTGTNYSSTTNIQYYAFDLIQKSLLKSTLLGEHKLGAESKLDWLASYNFITNNQPDQRKITYSRLIGNEGPYFMELNTLGKANNRLFGDLSEHVVNANVNFSTPLNFLGKSKLKMGLSEQIRMRSFSNRYVGAVLNTSNPEAMNVVFKPMHEVFTPQNINNNFFRFLDQTIDGDFYDATAMTTAAYLMLESTVWDKLKLVYGLRAEHYYTKLDSYRKNEVDEQWLDFLPSLNAIYGLNDKTNLRFAYFKSLVRPEFREMANLAYFDYEMSAIFTGNPYLTPTSIHNFDIKYEYFPNPGEILAASVFYKHFTNTIENSVYASNTAYEVSPQNFEGGYNVGIELEVRKKIDFISDAKMIRNLTFYTNVSLVKSSIKLPANYYIMSQLQTERPLSGQSPLVINSSLGYLSDNGKLGLNVLYNYIGKNLHMIGNDRISNVYFNGRNILDLQASYQFTERFTVRMTVRDILNSPYTYYMDQNLNGKFERNYFQNGQINVNKDWIWQEFKPGTSIGLTLNYKL